MSKLPLSVVTAVLNEERLLPGFLKYVTSIVDEVIIIVDYRTTDQTAEIARKFKCKVLQDRGESDGVVFNNKNWGIEEAKNDWVLILDADERMDDRLVSEISAITTGETTSKANIYQTSFLNYEFGKIFTKCDQKEKPFVRLFRKGSFKYHTEKTAEGFGIQTTGVSQTKMAKLLLKLPLIRTWYLSKDKNISTLKGHLIHYSHPTINEFVRKIDHYSTREAKILFARNPNNSNTKLFFKLLAAPAKEFLYKYFIWRFYREGLHGFIAAKIYGFYHFLIYSKLFALTYSSKHQKKIKTIQKKYDFPEIDN